MGRSSSDNTKQRLIVAAGELFAEKGFKAATVREIGAKANANIASINYHFMSKEGLYAAVVKYIVDFLNAKYPIVPVGLEKLPPDEQLYKFIMQSLMRRHNQDRPAWFNIIISREYIEPRPETFEFADVMKQQVDTTLASIISKCAGMQVNSNVVSNCIKSIVGQVILNIHRGPAAMRSCYQPPETPFTPKEIKEIARHIAEFSLGGIKRVSKLYKSGK